MPQDVPDHHAVVVSRLLGLARQVLRLVALGQLRHGRCFTPLAPLAGGVLTAVDPLPDLLGLGPRCHDRPVGPGADAEPALGAVVPIREQESPRAVRVRPARREQPDGEAGQLGIPDQAGSAVGGLRALMKPSVSLSAMAWVLPVSVSSV